MTTTVNKTFEVNEPIEKVWAYLADPTKIVVCVPGASLTEKIDDRNFKGQVAMKLGPVKVKFNGEVAIEELDEANRKMMLKGKGLDAKGKGSADMKMNGALSETADGTAVDFTMELSIVGKIAQFGARLINEVTDHVLNQFIDNFKAQLAADTTFAPAKSSEETAASETVSKDASTAEKAQAVSDAAAEVQKAVADVQAAQDALSGELLDVIGSTETPSTNGVSVPAPAKKVPSTEVPQAKIDNSLNGFSLMMTVIKGWFSRLFGGGK